MSETGGEIHLADGRSVGWRQRISARARHVRLTLCARRGLEVVTPPGVPAEALHALVRARADWVARHLPKIEQGLRERQRPHSPRPESLVLPALEAQWRLEWRESPASRHELRELPGRVLLLRSAKGDIHAFRPLLLRWLRQRAAAHLPDRLEALSRRSGLNYGRVSIGHARTRWASCSSRGDIRLNLSLLFLPPPLLDHVLLHELCHTREMNHSPRFWALLRQQDPACEAHRRALSQASREALPVWLFDEGELAPAALCALGG
ncbi:MAG: SprT family zinc-dependent metalloprotease [Halothiobacillaceae bacterium]|nr:SprT family zinc-dependent metalloprotease [Halothiobacillaceae bacterium]